MDRIWKSGIMAGAVGALFILLGLVILGSWFKVFAEQNSLFLLLLLLSNLLAFVLAGLSSGILVSPYARNEMESLKSGMIAGCIVALFPVIFIVIMTALGTPFISIEPSAILGFLALAIILVSLVALSGMLSLVYTSIDRLRKQSRNAASSHVEDNELSDLRSLYDDLWKDARTLVTDMNRSIQMYLLAGFLMLVYGFVILAYAAAGWQRIYSGSPDMADYAAAIGETIGGAILIIVGPLLIRWYYKLKSRYARLALIEKGEKGAV
jgi:hypothetical protein